MENDDLVELLRFAAHDYDLALFTKAAAEIQRLREEARLWRNAQIRGDEEIGRFRIAASIVAKLVVDEFIEVNGATVYLYKGEYLDFTDVERAYLVGLTESEKP